MHSTQTIQILKNAATGEFRVPSPDGSEQGAYYTDDQVDAYQTAKLMFESVAGAVNFKVRSVTVSTI